MSEDYYKTLIKNIIESNDKEEAIKIIANKLNEKQISNEKEILTNLDKDKEIERLNNIITKNKYSADELNEIERLNNIINELEEEYINYMDKQDFAKKCKISRPYLDKLLKAMNRKEIYEFCKQRNKIKELKGSDKE